MRIFVGNLPWSLREEDLRKIFSVKGEVKDVTIIFDNQGRSKGFGFVEMPNEEEAKDAIKNLNGYEVVDPKNPDNKRRLRVDEARPLKSKKE
jgi:RNA recognition motif-containing protein